MFGWNASSSRRASSRKTRIETFKAFRGVLIFVVEERVPGKQGLKLKKKKNYSSSGGSRRASSRKTRIETRYGGVTSTTCPGLYAGVCDATTTAPRRGSKKAIAPAGEPCRRCSARPYRHIGARPSTTTSAPRGMGGSGGSGSSGAIGDSTPMW